MMDMQTANEIARDPQAFPIDMINGAIELFTDMHHLAMDYWQSDQGSLEDRKAAEVYQLRAVALTIHRQAMIERKKREVA